jgi:hypothetical protein
MMKFWSSGDGTRGQQNKLEIIDVSSRKIEQERVAVVNFGVNERSSNSRGSIRSKNFEYAVDHQYEEAGFGVRRDVLRKRKIFVQDDTKVTSSQQV